MTRGPARRRPAHGAVGARASAASVLVFGDFDAGRPRRPCDPDPRLAPVRRDGRAVRPEPARRGPRPVARRDRRCGGTASHAIVTVDSGRRASPRSRSRRRAASTSSSPDHHRVPPVLPAALAVVNPHRGRTRRTRTAASPAAASPSRSPSSCWPTSPAAGGRSTSPTSPPSGPSRTSPRSSARTGPSPGSGWNGCARAPSRRRGAPRTARIAPAAVDLETVAFAIAPRLNAAGRMGEALEAARLLLAEDATEAAAHADALEAANKTRRDLMKTAVAEARRPSSEGPTAAAIVRGPWPVGIVGLVAARLAEDAAGRRSSGRSSVTSIRASCRSDGSVGPRGPRSSRAPTCSLRYGGHAGAAGFELPADRWPAFRRTLRRARRPSAPPDPRAVLADRSALPRPRRRLRPVPRARRARPVRPRQPPAARGRARPDRDARPAGRQRTTRQLTLRRDRDVLDGIAFGRPGHRRARPRGRRDRRRRATGQPDVRRLRVAPARDPRRGTERRPSRGAPLLAGRRAGGSWPGGVVTRARPRPPRPATRTAVGPIGTVAAPVLGRRAADHRDRHAQPAQRPGAVRGRRIDGNGNGGNGGSGPDGAPVERRRRARGGHVSRARSSTPRAATSGSRPTRTPSR